MSRIVAILMLLILPLQAFAAAERQLAHLSGDEMDHVVAHAEHVPHHHDDDGAMEEDDSLASATHQLDFDLMSNLPGTLTSVAVPLLLNTSQVAPSFAGSTMPTPACTPPLRPPHVPA
ncbi:MULTISPECIES: hypothetical protein [unclassified Cupriavidus]|uniref:hypothetical protein n=1 Tax=Cupriavidus sp. H19C3 TaxID=3241603 RepID=UPI0011D41968|nr:MAG: hypothetical protein E6Q40_07275 [Cupriavidus sp.]